MSEYDKKLQEVNAKRIMFNSHINTLEFEHPKLYKKISHLFEDISYWMESAEFYMNELKQSIDTLEANRANDAHYMNRPGNILDTAKRNNPIYPLDERVKFGYDIKKDNPYV